MPELPEVETVAQDLRSELSGRQIERVTLLRSSLVRFPDGETFVRGLNKARITGVGRRGKYLLVILDRDDGAALVVHLGMTGHLDVRPNTAPERPHTHLRVQLDDGRQLRYADARRFGRLLFGSSAVLENARAMPRLGVEPLSADFTVAHLDGLLRRTSRSLKATLLDQTGVAGLGNIYIDEACFTAGVRPSRPAFRTTQPERRRLHSAIVEVLSAAVRNRGSSIDDYRDLWNRPGTHQDVLHAYGRAGLQCLRCGRTLRRTLVAGRGTTHCPGCQR